MPPTPHKFREYLQQPSQTAPGHILVILSEAKDLQFGRECPAICVGT
jgi:hypothetical protein